MIKLLKYLKKSTIPILFIITLLFLQANADLSLPEYTSKIVNVGIQQSGIENAVPKVITEETINNLSLLVSENDMNLILKHYKLIELDQLDKKDKDKYQSKYKNIATIKVYELINKNGELSEILKEPLAILSGLKSDNEQIKNLKKQIIASLPSQIDENTDIFVLLKMLPKEAVYNIIEGIKNTINVLPPSIVEQTAIAFIKEEYLTVGINIGKLQSDYILISGAKMIGIALISMIASFTVGYLGARIGASVAQTLRRDVFKKVISFSAFEFKNFSTSSLITRTTNDIQQVGQALVMMLRVIIYAPILGIGGVLKVLDTNTSMAWIIALAVGIIFLIVLFLFIVVMPKFNLSQKLLDKLNLVSREIINGLPVIRAFSAEKHEDKRFKKASKDISKTNIFINTTMSFMMPLMFFVMNAIAIVIVWNGAHHIDKGIIQVGDMIAFIQYTMQIIMAFLMISFMSIILPRAAVSAKRISEVLTSVNTINDPKTPKNIDQISGKVEFKNVSFRYPDADENILCDINFVAEPGKTTAFIGSTGSGKSTLINLIPRFFEVTKGEILIDGVNIKDVTQHDLRSKIGYVPQKGILFSGTIESNIKYGSELIDDKKMEKSATIAQAKEFIESKKEKYGAEIAQGGSNVSGGQKQRLSIARAIAIDPIIYIFDDSFSALDFKTDVTLRKALKAETKNSTVLIVAQRISTIMNADKIIVLDNGKIVGMGQHDDLIKNCEVYREIASSQLTEEELGHE